MSLIPLKGRDKMGARARRCFLLGYGQSEGKKGYKLWYPESDLIFYSRDIVRWDEDCGIEEKWWDDGDLDLMDDVIEEEKDEFAVHAILNSRTDPTRGLL